MCKRSLLNFVFLASLFLALSSFRGDPESDVKGLQIAFMAALDDVAKRGIKYVVLPGDFSDDGQPVNVRGLPGRRREEAALEKRTYPVPPQGYLISWVKKVTDKAEQLGKTLVVFSHYPMLEFNDDASAQILELLGPGAMQLHRVPGEDVAQIFADAGIKLHFGGHMHINDTGIRKTAANHTLINVQTPSLAAYIPAGIKRI